MPNLKHTLPNLLYLSLEKHKTETYWKLKLLNLDDINLNLNSVTNG